ncbi:hypothetical protein K435DRAFT_914374 [Dendrothele bispora CBS 962.96]|uniref:Uncharacterized protein n=1 Tax=Dendrothele bispora (strain CBS 962.96) TaxID=1314807 RepID=A0A4S8KIX1_DENBC|nr:hypothetical protein K435DRAFT_914374 [Dendrothele bispora CBS 962.96]
MAVGLSKMPPEESEMSTTSTRREMLVMYEKNAPTQVYIASEARAKFQEIQHGCVRMTFINLAASSTVMLQNIHLRLTALEEYIKLFPITTYPITTYPTTTYPTTTYPTYGIHGGQGVGLDSWMNSSKERLPTSETEPIFSQFGDQQLSAVSSVSGKFYVDSQQFQTWN